MTGRPKVLQVTVDCPVEEGAPEVSVAAVSVYRRKAGPLPLRYGWDGASP